MANEGGKEKRPSAGLAAWRALQNSKELDGAAARALEKADLVGLKALKSSGWLASGDASRGWFNAAMSEPSGESLRWLLEHYPSQAAGGAMWSELDDDPEDWRESAEAWSSRALAEIEEVGIRTLGPMKWLANESTWGEAFERKARALSERGWRVSDALSAGGSVRGLAEKAVKNAGARSQKALARIIEREEIEKATSLPMGGSAKAARL